MTIGKRCKKCWGDGFPCDDCTDTPNKKQAYMEWKSVKHELPEVKSGVKAKLYFVASYSYGYYIVPPIFGTAKYAKSKGGWFERSKDIYPSPVTHWALPEL